MQTRGKVFTVPLVRYVVIGYVSEPSYVQLSHPVEHSSTSSTLNRDE